MRRAPESQANGASSQFVRLPDDNRAALGRRRRHNPQDGAAKALAGKLITHRCDDTHTGPWPAAITNWRDSIEKRAARRAMPAHRPAHTHTRVSVEAGDRRRRSSTRLNSGVMRQQGLNDRRRKRAVAEPAPRRLRRHRGRAPPRASRRLAPAPRHRRSIRPQRPAVERVGRRRDQSAFPAGGAGRSDRRSVPKPKLEPAFGLPNANSGAWLRDDCRRSSFAGSMSGTVRARRERAARVIWTSKAQERRAQVW